MLPSLYYTTIVLRMNARLFTNALDGVTEAQAKHRISDHSNPIEWIAAHAVSSRYTMLFVLGKPAVDPYRELFENFKGYDVTLSYPDLESVRTEWQKVSLLLKEALATATEEQLKAECAIQTPIGDTTNGGTLAFVEQHETYCLGQLAFLKKYHTNEAMKY